MLSLFSRAIFAGCDQRNYARGFNFCCDGQALRGVVDVSGSGYGLRLKDGQAAQVRRSRPTLRLRKGECHDSTAVLSSRGRAHPARAAACRVAAASRTARGGPRRCRSGPARPPVARGPWRGPCVSAPRRCSPRGPLRHWLFAPSWRWRWSDGPAFTDLSAALKSRRVGRTPAPQDVNALRGSLQPARTASRPGFMSLARPAI
jgi:hypothetical protein